MHTNDCKKVGIVLKGSLDALPPILAVIDELINLKNIDVRLLCGSLSPGVENKLKNKGVSICTYGVQTHKIKQLNSIIEWINIRMAFKKSLKINCCLQGIDTLWVGSGDTALAIYGVNLDCKVILQLHELYDTVPHYSFFLRRIAKKVNNLVCPDYYRAHILKVVWKLPKLPDVFLNRPFGEGIKIDNETSSKCSAYLEKWGITNNKKILLYQGHIDEDRDIEPYALAISKSDEWQFVCMGKEHGGYLHKLKKVCPSLVHIPHLNPPEHLKITACATVGIITYKSNSLNEIFCAPNKIWEYAAYGIPFIGPDLPGLTRWAVQFNSGVTLKVTNAIQIQSALAYIVDNQVKFRESALKLYNLHSQQKFMTDLLS